MKHWTQHLPEGRRIFEQQVSQMALMLGQIEFLGNQITELKANLKSEEMSIQIDARKQYSEEEIADAILEFCSTAE